MKGRKLTVEIRGVGFVNKGAELMLHAIKQEFDRKYCDVQYVLEVSSGQLANDKKRLELQNRLQQEGIGARLTGSYKKIPIKYLSRFLYGDFHSKINIVSDNEVDVILDGSGFAYGDQWGATFAKKRMTDFAPKWKKGGKSIILLPQAFGPFRKVDLNSEMDILLENSHLIFARDPISYNHISSFQSNLEKIFLKPDFTNLLVPNVAMYSDRFKDKVAIIPNFKMISATNQGENYLKILESTILIIQDLGVTPFFLMHEGKKDEEIAVRLNQKLNNPIEIVWEESAIGIKAIIGASYAVVTSRFHGLVSALSQGVPCLATSWSHKYEMLLKDYDRSNGLIPLSASRNELKSVIMDVIDRDKNSILRKKLSDKAVEQKGLTKEMWEIVHKFLGSRNDTK